MRRRRWWSSLVKIEEGLSLFVIVGLEAVPVNSMFYGIYCLGEHFT